MLNDQERRALVEVEARRFNQLRLGGRNRPYSDPRLGNALFTAYWRKIVCPVGRAMVLDRCRRRQEQLYRWKSITYVQSGVYSAQSVESVSPWLAKDIDSDCSKETNKCPHEGFFFKGMLMILPENDKDFKGAQFVNGGLVEAVKLYLDPREDLSARPIDGSMWTLRYVPVMLVVRPMRSPGHGEVSVDLAEGSFVVPPGCYALVPKKTSFAFNVKVPQAVAHARGFATNQDGEVVVGVYRTGSHLSQGYAITNHALQGATIRAPPPTVPGDPGLATPPDGVAGTASENGVSGVNPLLPDHLIVDPHRTKDAGFYICVTRVTGPYGLTLVGDVKAQDLLKRDLGRNIFAEEELLFAQAKATRKLFSDKWLFDIAPAWVKQLAPDDL